MALEGALKLKEIAYTFTEGFAASLADKGVTNAEVYLSQNDGTLMTMEHARRYPILTIACGPTNSIRGASYLSRRDDAIVIDVGGTTTDLGVLAHGFPRESGVAVTIGGVRTNFRMPDVVSIGLGGGSIVRVADDGTVCVGPDSVGYEIARKALVFGGDTMTATDIAVRLGMAEVGGCGARGRHPAGGRRARHGRHSRARGGRHRRDEGVERRHRRGAGGRRRHRAAA